MNPYHVEWEPSAEEELARIWMQATEPNKVVIAQVQSDRLLSRAPLQYGRHLSDGLYSIAVPPPSINFTHYEVERTIEVNWVRLI